MAPQSISLLLLSALMVAATVHGHGKPICYVCGSVRK